MIESLTAIFNRVEEEGQILLQSRETTTKSLYKGGRSKEKIQESQRYFHNKYSVQSIWNCKEDLEWGNTKQHVQYADCRKEEQINNG